MQKKWTPRVSYADPRHAGSKSLMMAGGLCEGDFDRPMIGIHNTYGEGGPGHIHLRMIADEVRAGIYQAGGVPIEFGGPCHCPTAVPSVHDLPQRDIIAANVENFVELHLLDGLVCIGSCDKPNPGHWLAAARVRHIPVMLALGGPSQEGRRGGRKITASTAQEAGITRDLDPAALSEEELEDIVRRACPGPGACALCGTANTTALLTEALGLTLPFGGSAVAVSSKRRWLSRQAGRRVVEMVYEGLTASKVLTADAVENAIILEHAIGGSSNAILHLLALADELAIGDRVNVDLIEKWGGEIPCIANILPGGEYSMEEFDEAGGMPAVMKTVEAHLNANAVTVSGKTVAEDLESARVLDADIVRPLDRPAHERGLVVLRGNLADSAIARFSVFPAELLTYQGPLKVFDSYLEASEGIHAGSVKKGEAIVVRYEGPRGGPGMPDILTLMYELRAAGLSTSCPVITDAKLSGFAKGPFMCQVTPEAAVGGPLAVVRDGDIVEVDIAGGVLNVRLSAEELSARQSGWTPKEPRVKSGYLTLWARLANSAAEGAGLAYRI